MKGLTVVFDLDGTLVDTAPDLRATLSHVLEQIGHRPVTAEEVRPIIAFGARRMLQVCLEGAGDDASKGRLDELMKVYLDHYREHLADASRPFEGALPCLDWLDSHGVRLGVCTNKYEDLTFSLLDRLGLERYFRAICGVDTFEVRKPHPDHLTCTIKMAGGRADRAIMIGDSETDIATAKAAGVPVIAVSFGYSDRDVRDFDPDALIDHYRELPDKISQLERGLPKA